MQYIFAEDVETAIEKIVHYLEDTSNDAPRVIYYNGWRGLGASTVLRAIEEHPPPSLWEKFDKIVHIDCSRWKSRRALQREIADKLKLTQQVAAVFHRQDEEDDFNGLDQGSRAEVGDVTAVIARYLAQYRFLVVFHNGSDDMVDLTSCGIPPPELFRSKVLWCFSGRLRFIDTKNLQPKHSSDCFIETSGGDMERTAQLAEEAREIAFYTHKLDLGVTPEIVKECYMYLLSLKGQSRNKIDYKWTTHASSYWVCDGIIQGGHDNRAWELAHALQQHITLEDDSSFNMATMFGLDLVKSTKNWICSTYRYLKEVPPGTTSLFFEPRDEEWWGGPVVSSLPSVVFHQAGQLRVLKLWRCTFSFSSPPFHCCRNLRFLGLVSCADEQKLGKEEETSTLAVETFQRLWVLDVCDTNWQLSFPVETEEKEQVAADIREVHIDRGRIWRSNLAWKRLPNLHKLRVVEPTSPWETGKEDEFMGMVKLELLDLSGNSTIQVLPSLSGATCLSTLVLDDCVGLEHVGPEGLPPSLQSFRFHAGSEGDHENKARISRISLAGCARLTDFRLCGSLPNLEELDLSHTAVKKLDLRKVVQLGNPRLLLMGCEQIRSISWPLVIFVLRLLCIDTRAGQEVARKPSSCDSSMVYQGEGKEYCLALVAVANMSFLRALHVLFRWASFINFKLNLCWSSIIKDDGRSCNKEKMGRPYYYSTGLLAAGSPLPKSLAYHDVSIEQIATKIDDFSNAKQFQPLDFHMEIGEGISDVTTDTVSERGREAIRYFMDKIESLHVHDSFSITTVVPQHIFTLPHKYYAIMNELKWCRVERCPKLHTVFATDKHFEGFSELAIFWASHLLMARSIWSRPRNPRFRRPTADPSDDSFRSAWGELTSFKQLRAIHIHFCHRLRYVLDLSWQYALSNQLETLHIHCCGDLRHVFPVEQEFLEEIAASHETRGMLEFPKLKDLYLHDLPGLQLICEAKMFAPNLETINIRGCWGLRRLPATDRSRRQDGRPAAVDCEKDWWDNLEWDGMEFGHHPSLFETCHSKYYKKRHLRGTVLR